MKIFIHLILFLGFITNPPIKKRILSHPVIISKADVIVEGNITSVSTGDGTYTFMTNESLKGNTNQEIKVKIWEEWTCDKRLKPLKKGQQLLLFLTKNDDGVYKVINGSTGELFVTKDNRVPTYSYDEYPEINEFKEGIKMFLSSYKYSGDLYSSYKEQPYFQAITKQSDIDKMISKNRIFKSLVKQIESKIKNS